jgi:hypothetical protein
MRHRVHRAHAGEDKPPVLVADRGGRPRYYDGNDLPSAPAGAVLIERMQANWDGGPPLRQRVAIVEEELRIAPATLAAVESAIAVVARALQPWGVVTIATCTWVTGDSRAVQLAAHRPDNCLRGVHDLVQEFASDHGLGSTHEHGPAARAGDWERMARAGLAFPAALDDPHCIFGPSGPPIIPESWRRRPVRALENPFPAMVTLESMGRPLYALAGDEAVLRLPDDPA